MSQSDSATKIGLGYWRFTANATVGRRISELGDDELREVLLVARAETTDREGNTMDTTKPDLQPLYDSIGGAREGLSMIHEAIEQAHQAAVGVEHEDGTWDDSGDDMEPFELVKAKIAEARNALAAAQTELACVEGLRRLRSSG